MLTIKAEALDYDAGEEHFLRRLGGAVVVQWDSLPQSIRRLLVEQAAMMADRDNASGLDYQIKQFIEKRQK